MSKKSCAKGGFQPPGFCVKRVFLEIFQNSQENTSARVSFLIKLKTFSEYLLPKLVLKFKVNIKKVYII